MPLTCGIVGLPNVGKSTIFNALTNSGALIAKYPFSTVEPNIGIVEVPDARLKKLGELYRPKKLTPAKIEFIDIAGLVKGASQGEGLGNKFLSHIREVDAIIHIVRCFKEPDVGHIPGDINPERDIEIVNTELILDDIETIEKRLVKVDRASKTGDKRAASEMGFLRKLKDHLNIGNVARSLIISDKENEWMKDYFLLSSKPVLYVANGEESDLKKLSPWIEGVFKFASKEGAKAILISGKAEAEIASLSEEERMVFLKELGIEATSLDRLIRVSYELLGLITFFTVVGEEVRAWSIPQGTSAEKAAGKIHSDM
ncbi:MAG: redox-regulated ATPase YchF, partial [Nitrospirae bacterium]|nr:redox-regulated ATPase YchF [Nitrospirota bacterium]